MCKVMAADGPSDVPEDAIRFYRRAGFTEERLDRYRQRFGQFGANIAPLPAGYSRINDGQYIDIGGREWRAVIGHGHAPEHVCLYCPELKVIIAGDQILPKITPNVSVQPSEPNANPLRDFINSCGRFREMLPPDLLVLPAHESLYEGVHERLTELRAKRDAAAAKSALDDVREACRDGSNMLERFVAAAHADCTLGEIADVLREEFGHYEEPQIL